MWRDTCEPINIILVWYLLKTVEGKIERKSQDHLLLRVL